MSTAWGTAPPMSTPSKSPSPEQERLQAGAAAIFIDLEYVAALPLLSSICSQQGIALRSYAKEDHPMASRATHTIQSKEREAVNMQMVWDMATYCSDKHQAAHVLLVTDDRFGKTLASLDLVTSIIWVPLELDLPQPWRRALGRTSAKDFFTKQPDERRRARSRSRSRSRGGSLSRGNSLSCDDDVSDGDGSGAGGSGGEGSGGIGGGGEGAGGGGEGGGGDGGGGEGSGGEGSGGEGSGGEGSGGLRDGQEAALVKVARADYARTDHSDASSPAGAPGQGQPGQGWEKRRRRWVFGDNGSVHPAPDVTDTPSPTTTARIFDRHCDAAAMFAASERLRHFASPAEDVTN